VKTGVALAAIVLLVVLAAPRAFAEDAGATARDNGKSDNGKSDTAPLPMHGPSSSGEEGAGGAGNAGAQGGLQGGSQGDLTKSNGGTISSGGTMPSGGDAAAPGGDSIAGGKPPDDIDTRITVQPHRGNNKGGHFGDNKSKSESTTVQHNVHRRAFRLSPPPHQTVRNAIGIPVPRHEGTERHEGEHRDLVVGPRNPASGATAAAEGASGHFIRPEGSIDRPLPPPPNLLGKPPAENGRGISGTGLKAGPTRHSSGTASLGGAPPTVNGINGTTIRRKY
jgi:hypothetical protein